MNFFCLALLGTLTVFTGVFGKLDTEEMCTYAAYDSCRLYSIYKRPFPGNENELQNACEYMTSIKECITAYTKRCIAEGFGEDQDNGSNMSPYLQNWYDNMMRRLVKDGQMSMEVLTEICETDSKLHSSVISEITCFKNIFDANAKYHTCGNYTEKLLGDFKDQIDKIGGRPNEFNDHFLCLQNLFDVNCYVNEISRNCSFEAKASTHEIIERGFNVNGICPASMRPEILELLEVVESSINEDIYVKQLLETQ